MKFWQLSGIEVIRHDHGAYQDALRRLADRPFKIDRHRGILGGSGHGYGA